MKKVYVFAVLLCTALSSFGQSYQTQAGTIQAVGRYNNASASAVSNHLFMHLNYEKAEMHMRLSVATLVTDNDTVRQILKQLSGQEMAFDGKMNISFIQTQSHPKQKFTAQGMLHLNGTGKAFGINLVLEHIARGNASCILSGDFIIDLKLFNIENIPPGEEKIAVKFNQLVLKKSGEQ